MSDIPLCVCGHRKRVHYIRVGGATPCDDNRTCPCKTYRAQVPVPKAAFAAATEALSSADEWKVSWFAGDWESAAQVAVVAAAPSIAAQAWEEGRRSAYSNWPFVGRDVPNPYREDS